MPAWLWWMVIAIVLAAAEIASVDFFFAMFAIGAIAAAIAAALGASVVVQVLVLAVVSVALIFTLRPIALRQIRRTPDSHTNWRKLIGSEAVVLQRVDRFGGLVKLGGEEWTARPANTEVSFDPTAVVRVVRIDGATAIVDTDGSSSA